MTRYAARCGLSLLFPSDGTLWDASSKGWQLGKVLIGESLPKLPALLGVLLQWDAFLHPEVLPLAPAQAEGPAFCALSIACC